MTVLRDCFYLQIISSRPILNYSMETYVPPEFEEPLEQARRRLAAAALQLTLANQEYNSAIQAHIELVSVMRGHLPPPTPHQQ